MLFMELRLDIISKKIIDQNIKKIIKSEIFIFIDSKYNKIMANIPTKALVCESKYSNVENIKGWLIKVKKINRINESFSR